MSIKNSIRKALQGPLNDAFIAASIFLPGGIKPAIEWPGLAIDRSKLQEFVRFSFHMAPTRVLSMGPAPQAENQGLAKIGIFTRAETSEDRNDTIAGIVEAAYPYGAALVFDGVKVIVDKVDHGDFVPSDAAWYYSPVNVNWTIYRRL